MASWTCQPSYTPYPEGRKIPIIRKSGRISRKPCGNYTRIPLRTLTRLLLVPEHSSVEAATGSRKGPARNSCTEIACRERSENPASGAKPASKRELRIRNQWKTARRSTALRISTSPSTLDLVFGLWRPR